LLKKKLATQKTKQNKKYIPQNWGLVVLFYFNFFYYYFRLEGVNVFLLLFFAASR